MKKFVAALLLITSWGVNAQTPPPYVENCNPCNTDLEWMLAAADAIMTSAGTPFGYTYVGNTATGELRGYTVNMEQGGTGIPLGIHQFTASTAMKQQYAAYSAALRADGGVAGVIQLQASSTSTQVPDSAFDVIRDGANRQAVINWASDSHNWPGTSSQAFYAKNVIQMVKQFRTGQDYIIRLKFNFSDGGSIILNFDSACQCLVFAEARDSAGNLISTAKTEPVPVDYSSYDEPGANLRLDYDRGMDWLRSQGVLITDGRGGEKVRTGTVLIGPVVTLPK